jgi:deoxyhypusine synthase
MSPTRRDERSACAFSERKELVTSPVQEAGELDALFERSLPSFGAAYLRRIWTLLDEAVGKGLPMTLAVSGPVTVSGQHFTWLGPLLETGWFCLLSTTDAVCYHDGHRALDGARKRPFHEVPIFGDDGALRDEATIRVTDVGFDEEVLLEQDRFLRALLKLPEFQRRMTGVEFRHLLGRFYAAQEKKNGAAEGLLALCSRKSIPIFVGAPADGSVFLNSMALWALERAGGAKHRFDLDLHGEVFESCAYHWWGIRESDTRQLGTLILGGGVPKNFNLQPEPALSQVLGFHEVEGYQYDIQITTAPITDGSLSSCPPAEAVTWGKVDKNVYKKTTESMQCDYSIVMPFLVRALLDKRARFERWAERMGRDALFEKHPAARGYLRERAGYQLFARRDELVAKLAKEVERRQKAIERSSKYPLAATSLARTPAPEPSAAPAAAARGARSVARPKARKRPARK